MLDFIYWNADPVFFSLGPISVRWYGLAFAVGFIIGYWIVARMFRHEGAPERWLGILLTYVMVATIVGARLGHVLFYEWDYYSQHPAEILQIWNGGLASHGGTIANIIAVFLFSWIVARKPASWTFDKLVIAIALVGGLIRLGNLMNSEIYGGETTLPWGFVFLRNGDTVPSHPTQIYEALCYFALFGLLMWMYWKKNAEERPWLITGVFFGIRHDRQVWDESGPDAEHPLHRVGRLPRDMGADSSAPAFQVPRPLCGGIRYAEEPRVKGFFL